MTQSTTITKKVSGRVSFIGEFTYTVNEVAKVAVKAVLEVADQYKKHFGDKAELIFFNDTMQEMVRGAEYVKGQWIQTPNYMKAGHLVTASGEYTKRPYKTKDGKKGVNHSIVVKSPKAMEWEKVEKCRINPWAAQTPESAPDAN